MKVVSWIIGVILILLGAVLLTTEEIDSGLLWLISGLLCLPPIVKLLESFITVTFSRWVKVLVVLIPFSIGAVLSSKTPTKNADSNQIIEPKIKVDTASGKDFVQVGDLSFAVMEVKYNKKLGSEYPDGIFLSITVFVNNNSNRSESIRSNMFAVSPEGSDAIYTVSTDGMAGASMEGFDMMLMKESQPKMSTYGRLVFDVPKKGKYHLLINPNITPNSGAVIIVE